ncbi:alpha/beta hydrolase [Methanospirillum purgamenti]|jgi:alpha-beta hydrolase superfamily lysophospholipase|uniref:Alpha/beta hydrolase n=1 Tax=Methanospirillum hungatei TaxID=2203 RepID=A0A8F5VMR1_METHU|nr:alpha/beta hydrolase [Methanospirillum hungatei]QXO94613.1 alpha/beta hydrolase [Methanospirillum hungatei]
MTKNTIKINNIPALLWGEKSNKLFIAVHGNLSHKEDTVIELLANEAIKKGYQVLSFDLPEHGDRKGEEIPCKVQHCVHDLKEIGKYAQEHWDQVSLFACSMGAYFSLLTYRDIGLKTALFLSPVVDMERIIRNMMMWFQVSPERLEKEGTIDTPVGQKLYWDYFCYVLEHPVDKWDVDTRILYGAQDNLVEVDTISNFIEKFPCTLEIMDEGEHYFHTDDQINVFTQWLEKNIE